MLEKILVICKPHVYLDQMSKTMSEPRSSCPISCGLDIIGDRWSLLVLRDLMLTNRREFGHFLNAGEGISTNILSDRLLQLQRNGLIEKSSHPDHGKKFLYALTDKGRALAPVLVELARWAHENVEGAVLPTLLQQHIVDDRDALIKKLCSGEPLYTLNL